MNVRKKIWIYSLIVIVGFLGFYAYRYIGTRVWDLTYPWNSFLFLEEARYTDFFEINERVFHMDPYLNGSSYPPLALLIALFFARIIPGTGSVGYEPLALQAFRDESSIGQVLLLAMYGVILLSIMFIIWKKMIPLFEMEPLEKTKLKSRWGKLRYYADKYLIFVSAGLSVLASTPIIYSLDRGNYLILTVLMLTLFCHFYGKNDYASAVFLALAASLKVYPLVFFLVFLIGKQWKPLLLGLSSGAAVTALSMLVFKGNFFYNFYYFLRNILAFSGGVSDDSAFYYRNAVGFRSLLSTPVLMANHSMPNDIPISQLTLFTSAIFLVLVIALCFLDKRPWRQMMYLCFFMILFPTPSYYYNLSYLIAPLLLLLFKKEHETLDLVYLIGLALLMIPKCYYYTLVEFSNGPAYVGMDTFLNPFILCTILVLSFIVVLRERGAKGLANKVGRTAKERVSS